MLSAKYTYVFNDNWMSSEWARLTLLLPLVILCNTDWFYLIVFSHYITLSSFQMPLTPKVTRGASTITCYMKYSPPGPARRLATQQVGTTKKENQLCSGANCSNTHNIISRWRHMSLTSYTEDNNRWVQRPTQVNTYFNTYKCH